MQNIEIKFLKIDEHAKLPTCNNDAPETGDSGYDIYACEDCIVPPRGSEVVPTGIVVGFITPGYWFRIEGRSGLGFKHGIAPHNGIIDNGYRGDLGVKLYNHSLQPYFIKAGDRIAQLILYPLIHAKISWTDDIHETKRGNQGFGSSGE